MPRETEPSLNERAFILQALQQNIRVDGRPLDAFRDVELTFGEEVGVADVRLGKTRYRPFDIPIRNWRTHCHRFRVMARVSAEVGQPFPDRKFDGIFTIVAELSPLASPAFEVGRFVPSLAV